MNKALPLTALLGGAAALTLRLWQLRTGFEQDTGLPVPGAPAAVALAVLLCALAAVMVLLSRRLPRGPDFPFSTDRAALLVLPVAGSLLMALSGGLDLLSAVTLGDLASGGGSGMTVLTGSGAAVTVLSPRMYLLLGALSLVCGVALLLCAVSCRRGRRQVPGGGTALLIAPVCLVARLVLVYRIDSLDPSLQSYYVELLALVFLTLALYRLSSFACGEGDTRRFALYGGIAVVLCAAALPDGIDRAAPLLHGGGGLAVLGFLLLHLSGAAPAPDAPEDAGRP